MSSTIYPRAVEWLSLLWRRVRCSWSDFALVVRLGWSCQRMLWSLPLVPGDRVAIPVRVEPDTSLMCAYARPCNLFTPFIAICFASKLRGTTLNEYSVRRLEHLAPAVEGKCVEQYISTTEEEESCDLSNLLEQTNFLVCSLVTNTRAIGNKWWKSDAWSPTASSLTGGDALPLKLTPGALERAYCTRALCVPPELKGQSPTRVRCYLRQVFPAVRLDGVAWPHELDRERMSATQCEAVAVWFDLQTLRLAVHILKGPEAARQYAEYIQSLNDRLIAVIQTGDQQSFVASLADLARLSPVRLALPTLCR